MAAAQRLSTRVRLLFWNVYCENLDSARIVNCLDYFEPDVAVLCEATEEHIEVASRQYPHTASARDYLQNGVMCHLVIAAKKPLAETTVTRHANNDKPPASWLAGRLGWVEFLDSLSAFIPDPGMPIVCLHLSAGCGPTRRRSELEAAAVQIPNSGPCIVAGDFNSFAEPWFAPLVAGPLRYESSDWTRRERKSNDLWFSERGFVPAVDAVTFPRLQLRMDQVYVRGLEVIAASTSRNCFGSDHRPIVVELSVHPPHSARTDHTKPRHSDCSQGH